MNDRPPQGAMYRLRPSGTYRVLGDLREPQERYDVVDPEGVWMGGMYGDATYIGRFLTQADAADEAHRLQALYDEKQAARAKPTVESTNLPDELVEQLMNTATAGLLVPTFVEDTTDRVVQVLPVPPQYTLQSTAESGIFVVTVTDASRTAHQLGRVIVSGGDFGFRAEWLDDASTTRRKLGIGRYHTLRQAIDDLEWQDRHRLDVAAKRLTNPD